MTSDQRVIVNYLRESGETATVLAAVAEFLRGVSNSHSLYVNQQIAKAAGCLDSACAEMLTDG